MSQQIDKVKKFIHLVEKLEFSPETATGLLHDDFLQWELPNQLNPRGQKSDAADCFKRMGTAKMILATQRYEILSTIESESRVVIETQWTATMAMDGGPFKKGQELKAYICMFFDFKDGRIHRVRNYDCFEPFN